MIDYIVGLVALATVLIISWSAVRERYSKRSSIFYCKGNPSDKPKPSKTKEEFLPPPPARHVPGPSDPMIEINPNPRSAGQSWADTKVPLTQKKPYTHEEILNSKRPIPSPYPEPGVPFTSEEQTIMDHINKAHGMFLKLDRFHPAHTGEWVEGIHALQHVMMSRVTIRDYPDTFKHTSKNLNDLAYKKNPNDKPIRNRPGVVDSDRYHIFLNGSLIPTGRLNASGWHPVTEVPSTALTGSVDIQPGDQVWCLPSHLDTNSSDYVWKTSLAGETDEAILNLWKIVKWGEGYRIPNRYAPWDVVYYRAQSLAYGSESRS